MSKQSTVSRNRRKADQPSKSDKRKAKATSQQQNGKEMFEKYEIREMLDKAGVPLNQYT